MDDKNFYVVKSNNLIEAFTDMTTNECKVVACLISKIKEEDEDFNIQRISVNDFNKLLNIKGSKSYIYLKNLEKSLLEKTIRIMFSNGDRLGITWFSYIKYINSEATLEVCFNPKLKEHLLKLGRDYTQYKLNNICNFSSSYSIQLYEILKRHEYKKKPILISLEELKLMLGIESGYTRYNDFKRKVLFKAQNELKEYSDISFEFEEMKKKRKIVNIKFIIKENVENTGGSFKFDGQINVNEVIENSNTDEIIKDFKSKYNGQLDYILTRNLIENKGIDCVRKCIKEFGKYVENANNVEKIFYDFTKKYNTENAYKKSSPYRNNKPIQSTNYEQRKYDDEFFDSLYDNIDYIKKG